MSNRKTGFIGRSMILSILVGMVAGAVVVLLMAPRSRRESTERIDGLSHDLKGRASATSGTIKDGISTSVS
jgi:gas vesicle protein